jgi:hypothetical protein
MKTVLLAIVLVPSMVLAQEKGNPADNLPPHITRLTYFGERADFSHDGKKIIFIEKTFGDVFEIEIATKIIRPLTLHYHTGLHAAMYWPMEMSCSSANCSIPRSRAGARSEDAELWIPINATKRRRAAGRNVRGLAPQPYAHRLDDRGESISREAGRASQI